MKNAMHNWTLTEPLEVTCDRLHRLGYHGIEISGEPDVYKKRYGFDGVKCLLERYRLECWGAVTIMTPGRDLSHPDPAIRKCTVEYMKTCIEMVVRLEGKVLCIVPATVGKTKPLEDKEQEWAYVVESLREVVACAQENGVKPGIEPLNRFETYLINRHDEALELAEAVGCDTGVVLDTFHMGIEEADPLAAIRATGSRLIDFHVADSNRRPAGQGHYDWKKVIETLREIGYDGYLTSEFVLPIDRTPKGSIREHKESAGDRTDSEVKFHDAHATAQVCPEMYDEAARLNIEHLKSVM